MSDNYFKTGLENLKKIDGTAGSNVIENLSDIAPVSYTHLRAHET